MSDTCDHDLLQPSQLRLSHSNITHGTNYESVSQHLQVETEVLPLTKARLVWLNHDWFAERWSEAFDEGAERELEKWLIKSFAVGVPGHLGLPPKSFAPPLTRYADRYGGTGGAPHGGSGRCINLGQFNAKGIGPTPLVPDQVAFSYGHGYLELSQAIKQTILSLIANEGFPYGAVPVVAIIDTGFDFDFQQDGLIERCAIVVRPNFLRAAHIERSLFFGTAGIQQSDQYLDAVRVREVAMSLVTSDLLEANEEGVERFLQGWASKVCDQLGYGRAAKLWGDHIVSSNICLDGSWCDLELFQTLPHWGQGLNQVNHAFGLEAPSILNTVRSLRFYLRKSLGLSLRIPNDWCTVEYITKRLDSTFLRHAAKRLGLTLYREGAANGFQSVLLQLYHHEQAFAYDADKHINTAGCAVALQMAKRERLIDKLAEIVRSLHQKAGLSVSISSEVIEDFFSPRSQLFGANLRREIRDFVTISSLEEFEALPSAIVSLVQRHVNQKYTDKMRVSRLAPQPSAY